MKMHSEVSYACSDNGKKWKLKVPKEIDTIKRPGVELAFYLELGDAYEDMGKPDADFVQEVLKYKNNITGIKVALCHDSCDYLLKEDFYFKHLEKIDIILMVCESVNCQNEHSNSVREACINFISRYANKLEHLKLTDIHDWYVAYATNNNDLPHLPNMKSLSLQRSGEGQASFVIKSVNFKNVTKLDLYSFYSPSIAIDDLNIRNLSDLSLCDVDEHWSESLLKNNSSTLTKLVIDYGIIQEYEIDFKNIKFSKLKHLRIGEIYETDALTIIENSKNTLEEIYLCCHPFEHKKLESVMDLQLPCLKKVHLNNQRRFVSSNLLLSLISACNDNTIILIDGKTINKSMLELIRENKNKKMNHASSTPVGGTAALSNGAGVKRKAPAPRKASPSRDNDAEESTFNEKLAEIKKLRSAGVKAINKGVTPAQRSAAREEPIVPKQVKTATGVKTFLKTFESWIEVVSSSGKIYYYNKKTRENTWKKPQAWVDEEMRLNPPIPSYELTSAAAGDDHRPPMPPTMPEEIPLPTAAAANNNTMPEAPKLTMKIKAKKKVNKVKKKVSKLPAAYQANRPDIQSDDSDNENPDSKSKVKKLTLDNAFESIEDDQETAGKSGGGAASQQPLVKTESQDGGGNGGGFGTMKPQQPAAAVATKENGSAENVKVEKADSLSGGGGGNNKDEKSTASNHNNIKEENKTKDEKAVVKKEGLEDLIKLAKTRTERDRIRKKGSAAEQAFQNLTKLPESQLLYGGNGSVSTGVPAPSISLPATSAINTLSAAESAAKLTGNPTYFTDYNIPCCLRRCKFPKEQDVLAELKINKLKKRNYNPVVNVQYDNPELQRMAKEAEIEQFYIELKNYNNHDRLLTSRLEGTLVYKIVDEVWDRYFHLFQIKILDGVYLECRPSGYSDRDELIYSRTGKNCGYKTFPEDLARCQGIMQAWNKDYCKVIYANKIFKVERDDREWRRDLEEIRKFLERKGY